MSNHIICFSPSGATLGQRILAVEDVFAADWELTQCFGADHESLSDWTKRVFQPGNNLLFIGAAGIAVRAIAPYVREKQSDPAVVVMDEKANWCIPILSGHLGGANLLANKLAKMTGAQAAITTATDVRGVWAVDSWAKQERLTVVNPSGIKEISAGLLLLTVPALFLPPASYHPCRQAQALLQKDVSSFFSPSIDISLHTTILKFLPTK